MRILISLVSSSTLIDLLSFSRRLHTKISPFSTLIHHKPSPAMAASEDSLRRALAEKQSSIESQGNTVRALKASNAEKATVDEAIEKLNALKLDKSVMEKQLQAAVNGNGPDGSVNKEAFRQAVVNTLERRLFYIPSFKIYRGVAGLYDYGPPGCAVKSNVLSFWRQVKMIDRSVTVLL